MQLRTPISHIRGLGSAKEGLGHWTMQRLTAIANVVLIAWFLISAMSLAGADYQETRAWLASPISAGLMLLLIASAFYHAKLGLQVVIEDYVHHEGLKIAALIAVTLATIGLGVISAVAVLKTSIAG
ncbi:MAG: succinate dehydrogenase, hydrophobic membrane anchor protein [Alphaproteobacteria bacterium]|nr:succinate dehydrogenase, hydrophobic membrane anchor protein [Alphaproteobacteria bacterium]